MAINNTPDVHKQIIRANVFIRIDDRYLVLRRSETKQYAPGVVHPFGGKVEKDENPYEAVSRHVREQTGLVVNNIRLEAVLLEKEPIYGEPYDWLIFHFTADYDSGKPIETDKGEMVSLSIDELKEERLFPSVAAVIGHIFDEDKGTIFATFEYDENKEIIANQLVDFCALD